MGDSRHGLRKDLTQIQMLLSHGTFLSFSADEKQALLHNSQKLLRKLDALAESYLVVGLLGGTGVGKSSLMNAMAGAEIASTSHRRPHTDQILIYRHVQAELPPVLQKTPQPWREITHEVDSVKQILLCDLPDFDSLVEEHRERVLRFLEHLDVLVWVTSPEKYADQSLYTVLRQTPKARQNFYFVLNKVDLFFQGGPLEAGYDQLGKVTTRFQQHLKENTIAHPLIYALSARESGGGRAGGGPWNQFPSFRHQIFQHRDTKEVMAIKSANLDVEVHQLMEVLEKEILDLNHLHQTVRDFTAELEHERETWVRTGEQAFELWLESHFDRKAFSRMADPSPLVGPGYGLSLLIQEWQKWSKGDEEKVVIGGLFNDKRAIAPLQHQLERIENQMAHQLLRRGLASESMDQVVGALSAKDEWAKLVHRLQYFVEARLGSYESASKRGFRAVQYLTYLLFLLFFLLALGGEAAWQGFVEHPSGNALGRLVLAMINTLFSPVGLAALGSYVLLQIFFGFWFYGRYKKFLQQRTQKFIEVLKMELSAIWEEELNSIITQLAEVDRKLEAQISAISVLRDTQTKD